jgi:ActR/RegA family two-component response regulator
VRQSAAAWPQHSGQLEPSPTMKIQKSRPIPLDELVREHIQRVLAEYEGNISAAARALGMHRRTLQRKLRKESSVASPERVSS